MVNVPREGCDYVVAVVGQPNVGKSTLFNVLTGRLERVGNFPGTTVGMNVGVREHRGVRLCFADLPGIYGLRATTADESVARDYVLWGNWDALLVLVDLTVGLSGLFLLAQVAQLTDRLVIALTKWDAVKDQGVEVDVKALEGLFKAPVVPLSALRGEGVEELLDALLAVLKGPGGAGEAVRVDYGELEGLLGALERSVSGKVTKVSARGAAALIVMGDRELASRLGSDVDDLYLRGLRGLGLSEREAGAYAASRVNQFLEARVGPAIRFRPPREPRKPLAYRVFGNPLTGVPATIALLFAAVLTAFAVNTGFPFNVAFESLGMKGVAEAMESYSLSGIIGAAFDAVGAWVRGSLGSSHPVLAGLLADGVLKGVGVVASFTPLVLITLMIMAAIEDSGLGPLMAASVHGLFARFGLSGRAVYPLFISLGCNVPGVMASRAALDEAERLSIIAGVSFIPCSARLVVLLAFVGYLLAGHPLLQAATVLAVYLVGALLYLVTALAFRRGVLRDRERPELVLEVPRPRKPSLRVIWWDSWSMTRHFLARAGTVLVIFVVVVWALLSFGPAGFVGEPSRSYAAIAGSAIGSALAPLFGLSPESSWKVGFAVLTGFIAKENLLATVAVMSGVGQEEAVRALGVSTLQGIALLALFMYYVPCMATLATIYGETRSWRMTALITAYVVLLALAVSAAVYWVPALVARPGLR